MNTKKILGVVAVLALVAVAMVGAGAANDTKYTVTFNMQGHGTQISDITDVTSGSTVKAPTAPTADGYLFGGWYKEAACTNIWNFSTDTVTENITLYAKWTDNSTTVKSDTTSSGGVYKFAVPSDIVLKNSTETGENIVYGDVSITPITFVEGKDIVMRLNTESDAVTDTAEDPKLTFAVHGEDGWYAAGKYAYYTMDTYKNDSDSVGAFEKKISDKSTEGGGYSAANNIVMYADKDCTQNVAVEKYIGFTTTKMPSVTGEYTGNLTFVVSMEDSPKVTLALSTNYDDYWYSDSGYSSQVTKIDANVGDMIKYEKFEDSGYTCIKVTVTPADNSAVKYYYVRHSGQYSVNTFTIGNPDSAKQRSLTTEDQELKYGDNALSLEFGSS